MVTAFFFMALAYEPHELGKQNLVMK